MSLCGSSGHCAVRRAIVRLGELCVGLSCVDELCLASGKRDEKQAAVVHGMGT